MGRKPDAGSSAGARRSCKVILFLAGAYLWFSQGIMGQVPNSAAADSDKSWTLTTDSTSADVNPVRTRESHTQTGNTMVDVRSIQRLGSDGRFEPYQDIETETVRVNATTVRTTTRTFAHDDRGAKTLFQITEEEKQMLADGANVIRTTSTPDPDGGKLHVDQREEQKTRMISPDVEETKTVVLLPSINGGLAPAVQRAERQTRSGDTVEIQKTTLLPDGGGNWQVGEARQVTIKNEHQNRSTEETVSRPDSEGKLSEVSRTLRKESQDASGDRSNSEESYSLDVPGAARDNNLHLIQRTTATQHTDSGGQKTIEVKEQPDFGNFGASPKIITLTTNTVKVEPTGAEATRTVQAPDDSGHLSVISIDMTKSNNANAINIQIAPSPSR
jgi:hypothetical protein